MVWPGGHLIFYPGQTCVDSSKKCEPLSGLRDPLLGRQWLRQLKKDSLSMAVVRNLLSGTMTSWQLCRMSDENIIDHMATLLESGSWHIHSPAHFKGGNSGTNGQESHGEQTQTSPQPAGPARKEPPSEAPVEKMLPGDADHAAIAAGMKLASILGIPFCEECLKATMANLRGGVNGN